MSSDSQSNMSNTTPQTTPQTTFQTTTDYLRPRPPRKIKQYETRKKRYRPDVTITSQFISHNITEFVIHKYSDGHTEKSETEKYKSDYNLVQELRNKWANKRQEFWSKNSVEILLHFKALEAHAKEDLSNSEKSQIVAEDQKNILRQIKNLGVEFKKYCKNISVSIRFPAETATVGAVETSDLASNPIIWLIQDIVDELKACEALQTIVVKLIVPQFRQNPDDVRKGVPIVKKSHVNYATPFKSLLEAPQSLMLFQQNGMDGKPVILRGEVIHHLNLKTREINDYRKKNPEANGTHVAITKKKKKNGD
ncbi:hypothetical protein B0J14DRAFT_644284 [Halenospora varia]|nr:hypothetical protein B0J14DRAFT_644284 [Halenospora varia]